MSSKPHSTIPDEAPKQALGKRTHSESDATSAGPSGAAVVPAKKRVRPTTAPRATSNVKPGGPAGISGHMFVCSWSFAKVRKVWIANQSQGLLSRHVHLPAR